MASAGGHACTVAEGSGRRPELPVCSPIVKASGRLPQGEGDPDGSPLIQRHPACVSTFFLRREHAEGY